MGRAHSRRKRDLERQKTYFREREKRRELIKRSLWEPLEKETILLETVTVGAASTDAHDQGEVLWDRCNTGSLQLELLEVK
jgi:hypothetical protein